MEGRSHSRFEFAPALVARQLTTKCALRAPLVQQSCTQVGRFALWEHRPEGAQRVLAWCSQVRFQVRVGSEVHGVWPCLGECALPARRAASCLHTSEPVCKHPLPSAPQPAQLGDPAAVPRIQCEPGSAKWHQACSARAQYDATHRASALGRAGQLARVDRRPSIHPRCGVWPCSLGCTQGKAALGPKVRSLAEVGAFGPLNPPRWVYFIRRIRQ